jgi:protein involved in polysaccharide export with SLBB domain
MSHERRPHVPHDATLRPTPVPRAHAHASAFPRPASPVMPPSLVSRTLVVLLLLAVCGGREGAAGQTARPTNGVEPAVARAPGQGALSPGDMVRITVWRKPELSGDFTVAADSSIKHPLYRDVKVAGLRLVDAEERLRSFLGRYEASPQLLLEPLLRVTVGGEVRLPNLYTLPPETTIAQAVALGGGPTADGRLDRVRVVRGERVIQVNLTRSSGGLEGLAVESGDQILVARKRHLYRDVVGPFSSLAAAIAAIVTLARQ